MLHSTLDSIDGRGRSEIEKTGDLIGEGKESGSTISPHHTRRKLYVRRGERPAVSDWISFAVSDHDRVSLFKASSLIGCPESSGSLPAANARKRVRGQAELDVRLQLRSKLKVLYIGQQSISVERPSRYSFTIVP